MTLNCTWRDMMREASLRLSVAGVENAPREARLLLAHALGLDPGELIARDMDAVDAIGLTAFEAAIARRLASEPVSRIRGWREFYGRRFIVTPAVLDPRPETELLVEEGLKRLPPNGRVLDLGTGSGCILLSILAERPDVSGVGVDLSPAALGVARSNADALGVSVRAGLIQGGWSAGGAGFDLVLSNPPYIRAGDIPGLDADVRDHDPALALDGGPDGLAPYREIPACSRASLRAGGWLGLEHGRGQSYAVAALMSQAGFTNITALPDLAGVSRVVFGRQ